MNKTVVLAVVTILAMGFAIRQLGSGPSHMEGRRRILEEHEVYARLAADRVAGGEFVVMLVPAPPGADKTLAEMVSLYRKPLMTGKAKVEVHAVSDDPALAAVTETQLARAIRMHPDAAFFLLLARVDADLAGRVRVWTPKTRLIYGLQQTVDSAEEMRRLADQGIVDLVAVMRPPKHAASGGSVEDRFARRYEVLSAPPRTAP